MNSDLFYAIVKLVSGEEILAQVCSFIENDEVLIVLDHPIIVDIMMNPKHRTPLIKIIPWMHLSDEVTHIIRRKDIITMSEVKDEAIAKIHSQYVRDLNQPLERKNKASIVGYVNNINDARKTFEKLYESDEATSNFE